MRITAQLIRVAGDEHLWSQSYTRDLTDIFAVQEGIARSVATELKSHLSAGDEASVAQFGTRDVTAYQAYLRGRQFLNQRNLQSLHNAVEAFKSALAADPGYVRAWSALGEAYALIPEYASVAAGASGITDTLPLALDAVEHALKLDPNAGDALNVRAYVRYRYHFEWAAAEADFRAAIASDPRNAVAHMWYGEMMSLERRPVEANEQIATALALEPLAPIMQLERAIGLYYSGQYEAALPFYDEALRLQPDFFIPRRLKAAALMHLRRFDDARVEANKLSEPDRGVLVAVIDALEHPEKSDAATAFVLAHDRDNVWSKAQMLAMLGRREETMATLERLYEQHDPYITFAYSEFDLLHGDPRYQALLKKIGLQRPAAAAGASSK